MYGHGRRAARGRPRGPREITVQKVQPREHGQPDAERLERRRMRGNGAPREVRGMRRPRERRQFYGSRALRLTETRRDRGVDKDGEPISN